MDGRGEVLGIGAYLGLIGRYLMIFIRLLLGGWMLLNGLNHFVSIFPQPMGHTSLAGELMVSLIDTGLFGVVKIIEIIIGILLIFDWFVPLALVMSTTISTVVWYNHAILDQKPFQFSMGNGCLVFTVLLLLAYLPYYLPMMKLKTGMSGLADFRRLPGILASGSNPEQSGHRMWTAIAGVLVTVWIFLDIHPRTQLPPGAGKLPVTIVREFLAMVYAQGRPTQAEKLYFSAAAIRNDPGLQLARDGRSTDDRIVKILGQGLDVVVYHRIFDPQRGQPVDAVDFFETDRAGVIINHSSIFQLPAQ